MPIASGKLDVSSTGIDLHASVQTLLLLLFALPSHAAGPLSRCGELDVKTTSSSSSLESLAATPGVAADAAADASRVCASCGSASAGCGDDEASSCDQQ